MIYNIIDLQYIIDLQLCNQSLGWEDPLEKGKAIHSSILAWRIPLGHKESDTAERLSLTSYTYSHMYSVSSSFPLQFIT